MDSKAKISSFGPRDRLGHATTEDVCTTFTKHREELTWLAGFLTGDEQLAAACVVDACALAAASNNVFVDWLGCWARRATIRSAIEMQRLRIAQLAPAYKQRPCTHGWHPALPDEDLKFVVACSDGLCRQLDVLCRFALVMRGIEKYSALDAALMLGVTKSSLEAAYCEALHSLESECVCSWPQPGVTA